MEAFKVALPFAVLILALMAGMVLAGCSGSEPVRYADVATTTYLAPNDADDAEKVPFRTAAPVDWRGYHKVVIDPVVIYRGPDQQFGDLSEKDKETLARYMQARFTERLKKRFMLVNSAGPETVRVRLTLAGAKDQHRDLENALALRHRRQHL
jgi:hypothetical protein